MHEHALVQLGQKAVFIRDGRCLILEISNRTDTWDLPGGRIHAGEGTMDAFRRELEEELDIQVDSAEPLIDIEHVYPDKSVRLEVWTVSAWTGTPRGLQGQPLAWVPLSALEPRDFPAANAAIIEALRRCL
jgi:8-oxo-dGTP diphosphatase